MFSNRILAWLPEINPMGQVPAIVDGRYKLFERYPSYSFPVLVHASVLTGTLCTWLDLTPYYWSPCCLDFSNHIFSNSQDYFFGRQLKIFYLYIMFDYMHFSIVVAPCTNFVGCIFSYIYFYLESTILSLSCISALLSKTNLSFSKLTRHWLWLFVIQLSLFVIQLSPSRVLIYSWLLQSCNFEVPCLCLPQCSRLLVNIRTFIYFHMFTYWSSY